MIALPRFMVRPRLPAGIVTQPLRPTAFAVFALACLGMAPVHAQAPASPDPAASVPRAPMVSVVTAREQVLAEELVVAGTLVPREEVLVAPEIDGLQIAQILAEEGDAVAEGAVLARLSRDTIDTLIAQNEAAQARALAGIAQAHSQIAQAEAAATEAGSALERTQSLRGSGFSSVEQLDQRVAAAAGARARLSAARDGLALAQADLAATKAQRRELDLRLERTQIRAPVKGVVSRRNARIGALASMAAEPLFRLIANGDVELEGDVLDTELARLKVGQAARVTLANGETHEGRIRRVPVEIDRVSRLGRVRIALPEGAAARIGAFARARIVVSEAKGVAIPASALTYENGRTFVQVVKDDRIEARPVVIALTAQGLVSLRSGVAPGERVVARATAFLRPGDAVRTQEASQSAPQSMRQANGTETR
jgi:HlyD family secretion protein